MAQATPSSPPLELSLDHLVLTVRSISTTIAWYTQHLDMRESSFTSAATPDATRYALLFGGMKINLHEVGKVGCPRLRGKVAQITVMGWNHESFT